MRVNFYATYRGLAGQRSAEIELPENATVQDAVDRILRDFPVLEPHWRNADGELYPHLTVILNKADITSMPLGLETPVGPADELDFVPPVGGG